MPWTSSMLPKSPWFRALTSLGSGLIMALAAPPVSAWPLAWVSLVPLFGLCWSAESGFRAMLYGLLWGLGYYGAVLAWITHLHPLTWMGVPWLGSITIAAFAWSVVTSWGTVGVVAWSWGLWKARQLSWLSQVLLATTLWCLLESLRALSPLDWASLSLTQSPHNLWVLHLSRFSGPAMVTAVIVAVNSLLAEAIYQPRSGLFLPRRSLAVALGLMIGAHGIGGWSFWQPDSALSPPLKLGLVQGNIPTRRKLTLEGIQEAVNSYLEGYQTLVDQGADAVLTPEAALPTVWGSRSARAQPFIKAVADRGVPLWLGVFAPVQDAPSRLGQSLIEFGPTGGILGRYDKVKLVPLGEYLPLESLIGGVVDRLSPLDNYLIPGDPRQQFMTSLGPVIVGICYDSAYSSVFRRQAANGGLFILTASNNDPYPPGMMLQHHALDVMRAIESDRWALRATNTGISGVVDAHGRTRWRSRSNIRTTHLATIYPHSTQSLYLRWGEWIMPLLAALTMLSMTLSGRCNIS